MTTVGSTSSLLGRGIGEVPDERWATIIALATIVVMRLTDVILPKGYISRWVNKYLMKRDDTPKD
jgi:hypothetical protein